MAYRLIVGLGNPGPEYTDTRHNAGFWFIDALARATHSTLASDKRFGGDIGRLQSSGDCRLLKPMTFMNASGRSVVAVATYFKIELDEILVVHDELDLDAGALRLKRGGGHGGHNGLRDIVKAMGGNNFDRLRLGIGRPPAGAREVTDHVLGRASRQERDNIDAAITRVLGLLPDLLNADLKRLMNELHVDPA